MNIPFKGTKWRCTDESQDAYGLTGVVTYGEIDPDWNGDNTVVIRYEDNTEAEMKYRRFVGRHERIKEEQPVTPASEMKDAAIFAELELFFTILESGVGVSDKGHKRRIELWKEILRRNQTGERYE